MRSCYGSEVEPILDLGAKFQKTQGKGVGFGDRILFEVSSLDQGGDDAMGRGRRVACYRGNLTNPGVPDFGNSVNDI